MKVERCPECGGKNLGLGRFEGYACLTVCKENGRSSLRSSGVDAVVCSDCGLVLELRVRDPHKFAPKIR